MRTADELERIYKGRRVKILHNQFRSFSEDVIGAIGIVESAVNIDSYPYIKTEVLTVDFEGVLGRNYWIDVRELELYDSKPLPLPG